METPAQGDMLRRYGCQMIQGFLLIRPIAVDELNKMLETRRLPVVA